MDNCDSCRVATEYRVTGKFLLPLCIVCLQINNINDIDIIVSDIDIDFANI